MIGELTPKTRNAKERMKTLKYKVVDEQELEVERNQYPNCRLFRTSCTTAQVVPELGLR